jgi:hypothetical protein
MLRSLLREWGAHYGLKSHTSNTEGRMRKRTRIWALAAYVVTIGGLLAATPQPLAAQSDCYSSWIACLEALAAPGGNPCQPGQIAYCDNDRCENSYYHIECGGGDS